MKWTVAACWLSQKSWQMTEWGWVMLSHIGYCNDDSLLIHLYWDRYHCRFFYKLEYFTEFYLLQVWILSLWSVCVCVCVCVLSTFITPSTLQNPSDKLSPILIKMVDFKNLAWAISFATWASRKSIYLPYRTSGKKSYYHTLEQCLQQKQAKIVYNTARENFYLSQYSTAYDFTSSLQPQLARRLYTALNEGGCPQVRGCRDRTTLVGLSPRKTGWLSDCRVCVVVPEWITK